jgi:hypothetical protein
VWHRIEEIELAGVRKRLAEERVQPEAVVAQSPIRAEPDRLYAPLPEIVLEEPKPAAPAEAAPSAPLAAAPAETSRRISPVLAIAIASVACVIGSILAAATIGDASEGSLFNTIALGGPAAAMIILAIALTVSGYLTVWRAVAFAFTGYVGFFLAVFSADFLTMAAPSFGTEGADIFGGFVLGGIGALAVLLTLVMLVRNPDLGRLVPIALSGVLLIGIATAVVMVVPGISIHRDNSMIWGAAVWHAALGLSLIWLLAAPRPSGARP